MINWVGPVDRIAESNYWYLRPLPKTQRRRVAQAPASKHLTVCMPVVMAGFVEDLASCLGEINLKSFDIKVRVHLQDIYISSDPEPAIWHDRPRSSMIINAISTCITSPIHV